jgi:hypothetical protein
MTRTTTATADRIGWADLPGAVRDLVQDRTGQVAGSRPAGGDRSDITATLDTESGAVFIKGAAGGMFARSLRNEAAVNPHVSPIAPRLLWTVEAEGWIILGFEHVDGRHADYSPGSPDLPLLRAALERLQQVPLPDHVTKGAERHYGGLAAMTGDTLLHTDLHPDNVLISADRAYLVDWAWACKGAAWAELAMVAFRLIVAGHTVQSAEEWGRSCPAWKGGRTLDAFVTANALSWQRAADRDPQEWKTRTARHAQQWVDHRAG